MDGLETRGVRDKNKNKPKTNVRALTPTPCHPERFSVGEPNADNEMKEDVCQESGEPAVEDVAFEHSNFVSDMTHFNNTGSSNHLSGPSVFIGDDAEFESVQGRG